MAQQKIDILDKFGFLKIPIQGLSSYILAIILVVLLILFSVVGASIPQEGMFSGPEIAQWKESHTFFTSCFEPLGFFHIFRSIPFIGLIFLLGINTLTCTVLRFFRIGGLIAFRGPNALQHIGFMLLHFSLLILFTGGLISAATKLDGLMILTEGQVFQAQKDKYLTYSEGPFRIDKKYSFSMRLIKVISTYQDQWHPVELYSEVEIFEAEQKVKEGVIRVNYPLNYQGLSFLQDQTGFSPKLIIRDKSRRTIIDSFVGLKTFKTEKGYDYRDFLPLPIFRNKIFITFYPSYTMDGDLIVKSGESLDEPILLIEEMDPTGQINYLGSVSMGKSLDLGKYTLTFSDLRRWSTFRVVEDHGYATVWIGLWLCVVSVSMRYLKDLKLWLFQPANKEE